MKNVWVCLACGKISEDRYGKKKTTPGWDESCFVNSVLVKKDHLVLENGIVKEITAGGYVKNEV